MSTEELRKHADAMKKYIVSERERVSVNLKKDDNIAKDELHPKVELGCPACHKNPCICESEEICPKCGKEICECGNAPEQMVTEEGVKSVWDFMNSLTALVASGDIIMKEGGHSSRVLRSFEKALLHVKEAEKILKGK